MAEELMSSESELYKIVCLCIIREALLDVCFKMMQITPPVFSGVVCSSKVDSI